MAGVFTFFFRRVRPDGSFSLVSLMVTCKRLRLRERELDGDCGEGAGLLGIPSGLRDVASVAGDGEVGVKAVSYTHLRAHETPEHLVCRLLLEKKKKKILNKN
eukprot:TRINITY_DN16493_c0_g1_i1.p2 TRINITY_DN16493_c0_g1~~TRINITY_DN16493_c0_g1_i1.p2  ORF type:complete len:103 (-),score=24.57 TRINITY_DN16493_c0_g1_i1:93-401(-)